MFHAKGVDGSRFHFLPSLVSGLCNLSEAVSKSLLKLYECAVQPDPSRSTQSSCFGAEATLALGTRLERVSASA